MNTNKKVLSLEGITKIYPGVRALDNVHMDFCEGEVHAIVGENGAGKSTFIKTIAGAIVPDAGQIHCQGQTFTAMTPHISRSLGIEVIYQEYNLIETLSAAENICLGEKLGKLVNFKLMNEKARKIFKRFDIDIHPNTPVRNLSSAQMQIVEIAKSISKDTKILIMDEPTAPLTVKDVEILMNIINDLKKNGVTIIYISHRIEEIFRISDRVTVLRDGQYIKTLNTCDTNRQELINLMVGRELTESYPQRSHKLGEAALEVKGISGDTNQDISFIVRQGEVLGISGLVGAGRTELLRAIYGADKITHGEIFINGEKQKIHSPKDAIAAGIGLIPEDRKRQGLVLPMGVDWNISVMSIKNLCKNSVVNRKNEKELAEKYKELLGIKVPDVTNPVKSLSGGNQQKVVIAKTLAAESDIIFFDEPTRGIDVGAKQEIYNLMNYLASQGKTIVMVSSEMEELLGMSDRVIVLNDGRLVGELAKEEFDQSRILDIASGSN